MGNEDCNKKISTFYNPNNNEEEDDNISSRIRSKKSCYERPSLLWEDNVIPVEQIDGLCGKTKVHYQCRLCGKMCKFRKTFAMHLKMKHPLQGEMKRLPKKNQVQDHLECVNVNANEVKEKIDDSETNDIFEDEHFYDEFVQIEIVNCDSG